MKALFLFTLGALIVCQVTVGQAIQRLDI